MRYDSRDGVRLSGTTEAFPDRHSRRRSSSDLNRARNLKRESARTLKRQRNRNGRRWPSRVSFRDHFFILYDKPCRVFFYATCEDFLALRIRGKRGFGIKQFLVPFEERSDRVRGGSNDRSTGDERGRTGVSLLFSFLSNFLFFFFSLLSFTRLRCAFCVTSLRRLYKRAIAREHMHIGISDRPM